MREKRTFHWISFVSFKFCLMYRYCLLQKTYFSLYSCNGQMVPEGTRGVFPGWVYLSQTRPPFFIQGVCMTSLLLPPRLQLTWQKPSRAFFKALICSLGPSSVSLRYWGIVRKPPLWDAQMAKCCDKGSVLTWNRGVFIEWWAERSLSWVFYKLIFLSATWENR